MASMVFTTINHSTLGEIVLVASDGGLHQLTFTGQRHDRPVASDARRDPHASVLRAAAAELDAYFDGALRTFSVRCAPHGTAFQQSVWEALTRIACGETTTYGAIAAALPSPSAARAVGTAVGRNPISIIVPCHRVVGASGDLTGYAGGLTRKRFLLRIEGVKVAAGS
jgi:methylated-DNA-[protein]-cysteine S-methyltransferase